MMHNIHLYGPLADKYGGVHSFDINTVPQGIAGLAANYKDFANDFRNGHYKIVLGEPTTGTILEEATLRFRLGQTKDVHVIPVAEGSGGGNHGGVKIVAGLALLTVAAFTAGSALAAYTAADAVGEAGGTTALGAVATALGTSPFAGIPVLGSITYGNIAALGVSLLVGGVANVLAPIPTRGNGGSFLFNGAVNTAQEGSAIPLVYGTFQVGSIVISSGLAIIQNPPVQPSPPVRE